MKRTTDTLVGDRWRLQARLGSGATGEVWRATDQQTGGAAAVKLLHGRLSSLPELVTRFAREVENGGRIDHPNAVRVLGGGRAGDGTPFVVMELLEGRPLRAWCRPEQPVAPNIVAELGRQIASGLGAAHAVGVVHRDLKPENVMLCAPQADGRPRAVVFDFGLSYGLVDLSTRLTEAEVRIGTPTHMAPEYIEDGVVGPASDFYALGVVLYELASGTLPFDGLGRRVMAAQVEKEPPPLAERSNAPDWLCEAVHALLVKDPERRPSTAEAVEALLRPR